MTQIKKSGYTNTLVLVFPLVIIINNNINNKNNNYNNNINIKKNYNNTYISHNHTIN